MSKYINYLSLFIILLTNSMALAQSDDIYCTNYENGITTRLTFLTETGEYNPNWSPCGHYIVHDVKGSTVPFGHSVFITNVHSGLSVLLKGAEGGNDASWSPDGQNIAFDRDPPFGDPPDDPNVYIVSAAGGTKSMIVADALDPDWSPNGQRIVFTRPSDGSIYTVNTDGSDLRFVIYGSRPAWSPCGKYIAFEYQGHVWTVEVDQFGEAVRLPKRHTRGQFYYGSPTWSSNSKMLAFHSDFDGEFDIYTVRLFWGQAQMLVGLDDYGEYDPAFSKTGFKVAYSGYTVVPFSEQIATNSENIVNPTEFVLQQNYPNPFNPQTTITYQLPADNEIELNIYTLTGNKIATLFNGYKQAGMHSVTWNAKDFCSGTYFYQLKTKTGFIQTRKLILIK